MQAVKSLDRVQHAAAQGRDGACTADSVCFSTAQAARALVLTGTAHKARLCLRPDAMPGTAGGVWRCRRFQEMRCRDCGSLSCPCRDCSSGAAPSGQPPVYCLMQASHCRPDPCPRRSGRCSPSFCQHAAESPVATLLASPCRSCGSGATSHSAWPSWAWGTEDCGGWPTCCVVTRRRCTMERCWPASRWGSLGLAQLCIKLIGPPPWEACSCQQHCIG